MKKTTKATKKKAGEPLQVDPSFAPIVQAFAKDPQVTLGKMLVSLGLKVNGKVFAMLVKGNVVAKLPKERVAELVGSGKGKYFDRGDGKPMKEWISVAPGQAPWLELAKEAHRFVKGGTRA